MKAALDLLETGRPARARAGGSAGTQVVHVINTAEVGGGAEHLVHLTRGLDRHGFKSRVIAGRDGPASRRLRDAGAEVEVVGPLKIGSQSMLARRFAELDPDLVHLHGSRAGLLGALSARAAGVAPVFYTAHMFSFMRRMAEPLRWAATRAERLTAHLSDRVICVSLSDRDEAARRGLPADRLVVVPNGIDLSRYPAASDLRSEFGFGPETPVIGMIARLVPQKDPLAFVRMAERVAERLADPRFVLVGDGPLRADVERMARPLAAQGRFFITGLREDVPELLATFDVAVFTSLWEAHPIALIEAMAAGRAIAATRLPGHVECLADGDAGCLAPVADPAALAEAVIALCADPSRRATLGRHARQRAAECYHVDRMVADTVEQYRAALALRR